MYFDWTYLLVLIGMGLSLLASAKVKSTYAKYEKVRSLSGLTGAQTAERILHANGIYDVSIEHISGNLTDHYDPGNKVLRLSDSVYGSSSVAAVGVAAHECGHAIQHNKSYAPLSIRAAIVPAANIGAAISWPLILVGLMLGTRSASFFMSKTRKVLSAAALTYVAAAASSILQLVRLIMIGRRND